MSSRTYASIVEPVRVSTVGTAEAVTAAAATVLNANPARKYLLLQNKDADRTIYVNTDGADATTDDLELEPKMVIAWDVAVPKGAVSAISDGACVLYVSEGV